MQLNETDNNYKLWILKNKSKIISICYAFLTLLYISFELAFRYRLIEVSGRLPNFQDIENLEIIGRFMAALGFAIFISKYAKRFSLIAFPIVFYMFFIFQQTLVDHIISRLDEKDKYTAFIFENRRQEFLIKNYPMKNGTSNRDDDDTTYVEKTFLALLPFNLFNSEIILAEELNKNPSEIMKIHHTNIIEMILRDYVFYVSSIIRPIHDAIETVLYHRKLVAEKKQKQLSLVDDKIDDAYNYLNYSNKQNFNDFKVELFNIVGHHDITYADREKRMASSDYILKNVLNTFKYLDKSKPIKTRVATYKNGNLGKLNLSGLERAGLCNFAYDKVYCNYYGNENSFKKILKKSYYSIIKDEYGLERDIATLDDFIRTGIAAKMLDDSAKSKNFRYIADNAVFSKKSLKKQFVALINKEELDSVSDYLSAHNLNNFITTKEFISLPLPNDEFTFDRLTLDIFPNSDLGKKILLKKVPYYYFEGRAIDNPYETAYYIPSAKSIATLFIKNHQQEMDNGSGYDAYAKAYIIITFATCMSTLMIFLNIFSLLLNNNYIKKIKYSSYLNPIIILVTLYFMSIDRDLPSRVDITKTLEGYGVRKTCIIITNFMVNSSDIFYTIRSSGFTSFPQWVIKEYEARHQQNFAEKSKLTAEDLVQRFE